VTVRVDLLAEVFEFVAGGPLWHGLLVGDAQRDLEGQLQIHHGAFQIPSGIVFVAGLMVVVLDVRIDLLLNPAFRLADSVEATIEGATRNADFCETEMVASIE